MNTLPLQQKKGSGNRRVASQQEIARIKETQSSKEQDQALTVT